MRLLVVADEIKVAGFLKRGLEEAGYAVDATHAGAEGEYLAQRLCRISLNVFFVQTQRSSYVRREQDWSCVSRSYRPTASG